MVLNLTINDFEDGNTDTKASEWTDWGSQINAQTGTALYGNYSGEFKQTDADVGAFIQKDHPTRGAFRISVQISDDTGNSGDSVSLQFEEGFDDAGELYFDDGGGEVVWRYLDSNFNEQSSTVLSSWSPGTTYDLEFVWDFPNDDVEICVDGTSEGTFTLQQADAADAGYDKLTIWNRTDDSGATRSVFIDNLEFDSPDPVAPSSPSASASSGQVDLSWTTGLVSGSRDRYDIYRAESSGASRSDYTKIADVGRTTGSYTDTAVGEGETYYYRVYATDTDNDRYAGSAEVSATTPLPAPSSLSIDAVSGTDISLSWTDNAADEDGYRVFYSTDGGSTYTQDNGDLAANTTSYTTADTTLDGEEYTLVVEVFTTDATARSGTVTATTDLPDPQQPALDTSVKDEITASYTDVINNGDYRVQIREDGETEWNSNATGFDEQVVGEATTSVTFTGLEDGEAYEVRLRTETEHVIGPFTSPVSAAALLPPPGSLSVTSTSTTSVSLSWTDDADNEDGYRVYITEKRLGQFQNELLDATLSVGATSYTAEVKPGTTFRFRVETFTEDATSSDSVTATTGSLANATAAAGTVPSTGPYLEIDHPSNGRTFTPEIVNEVAPCRALNELPTTTVEVRGDKWLDDVFVGADVRLYLDGRRQPADTLVRPTATPEGAELQLRGGSALLKRVEKTVVEQEADDFVRQLLQNEAPSLDQNVDDPSSTTRADTPVASASTQTDWEDILRNYPFADTDPRTVQNGTLQTERVAAYEEAENGTLDNTANKFFSDRFANGTAIEINAIADAVEIGVDVAYPIPSGRSEVFLRLGYVDTTHPGFDILVDGSVEQSITVDQDFFGTKPRWSNFTIDVGRISAGTHTIRVEVTGAASDDSSLFVDCVTINDSDYVSMNEAEQLSNGSRLSTPELHPDSVNILTDDVGTVRQVAGGKLSGSYNNTLRNQQVAISNDQGSTYLTADNSETVDGSFASGTSQIRGRFTLSAYSTSASEEPQFNAGQEVSSFDLFADLDTAPLLVDQAYDGEIRSILNEVADFSDALWEVRFDQSAGSQVVEWTFPGQREASGDRSIIDYETEVDATSILEKAVVYGTSKRIADEELTADVGTAVAMNNDYNQPADITVTSSDGATTYDRGTDYEFDPQDGTITALSGGQIADGETLLVDYRSRVRGVYEAPSWDGDESDATTETIPAATTDRSAESAALILVDIASEPITSADVVIEDLQPGTQLVEVISFVDLPTDSSFEVYSVSNDGGRIALRLGTRDTIDEVVSRLQSRLEATASRI